jgi:hypothetical protein
MPTVDTFEQNKIRRAIAHYLGLPVAKADDWTADFQVQDADTQQVIPTGQHDERSLTAVLASREAHAVVVNAGTGPAGYTEPGDVTENTDGDDDLDDDLGDDDDDDDDLDDDLVY